VIVCLGNACAHHAPHSAEPIARWLNSLGLDAPVLIHRFAPQRHPLPLRDVSHAIRLARSAAAGCAGQSSVGIRSVSTDGHRCATATTQFDSDDVNASDAISCASSRPDFAIRPTDLYLACRQRSVRVARTRPRLRARPRARGRRVCIARIPGRSSWAWPRRRRRSQGVDDPRGGVAIARRRRVAIVRPHATMPPVGLPRRRSKSVSLLS
jgi:hypothetical protein